jgi:hypothetical protein
MKRTMPRWTLVTVLLATTLPGCFRTTGMVSGKVTFQGEPVPAGSVIFVHADGATISGSIHEGSYSIAKVPTGACTILVVSLPAPRSIWNPEKKEQMGGEDTSAESRDPRPLPSRYNDAKESDLQYEVRTGQQTYDIDLKP